MLSDDGLDRLRAIYNLPAGQPAYDPLRQFDADETTYASYGRSEEHTSELQSLLRISYAVFCLKTKKQPKTYYSTTHNNINIAQQAIPETITPQITTNTTY